MEDSKEDKLLKTLKLLNYMGLKDITLDSGSTDTLKELKKTVVKCTRCRLHKNRKNVVFGKGNPTAEIVLIGEAPGKWEDEKGIPFVGAAGKELDRALEEAGIERNDIYITNVVKCRPPGNRNPKSDEIETCNPYLKKQLEIINPSVLVFMGNIPLSLATGNPSGITKKRGKIMKYLSFTVIPTFHPAYITRNPASHQILVSDFKKASSLV